ncbi:50S ribosomal protein L20 [candidate division WWE3 bacterium]|nr:50S ribosomal protein L20 [candidate division WWE3 bacterium]
MARVKGGPSAHKKHTKVLKLAKGYQESRSKRFRRAQEAVLAAGEYAFGGRKIRRRDLRQTWITRLSGALTATGLNYSKFINGLSLAKIELNRKMLSELAIKDVKAFESVVEKVKKAFK